MLYNGAFLHRNWIRLHRTYVNFNIWSLWNYSGNLIRIREGWTGVSLSVWLDCCICFPKVTFFCLPILDNFPALIETGNKQQQQKLLWVWESEKPSLGISTTLWPFLMGRFSWAFIQIMDLSWCSKWAIGLMTFKYIVRLRFHTCLHQLSGFNQKWHFGAIGGGSGILQSCPRQHRDQERYCPLSNVIAQHHQ